MANIDDLYKRGFGQLGSVFADSANGKITPPTNKVFLAITFVADTQLETLSVNAGGLTADTSNDSIEYIGTDVAAHNATAGSGETAITGGGGVAIDGNNTFPAGLTIFGRWTSVEIKNGGSGALIAYIGE
tara:strand:+ start:1235 stop:1624 length:390 start_codon:yes stop_codon:yes gene_type:complete